MNYIEFGKNNVQLSTIILGMMRISSMSVREVSQLIDSALDVGINAFDLADCYADGLCEKIVGEVLTSRPDLRDRMWIQSKCGIRREDGIKYFDFSKEHITEAIDSILMRLKTDHIDSLLLHRPDTLMEPEEIDEAIDAAVKAGKVIDFGVSNMNPMMIDLLKDNVKEKISINQIQMSAAFTPAIDAGLHFNMSTEAGTMRDGSILEYCRLHNIVIQTWSVLQYGYFKGVFIGNSKYPELNKVLTRIAKEQNVSPSAVAIAWVLRYPHKMQAVIGTTKADRVREMALATDVKLSRKEWYEIYQSAGNTLP
ncbi:MAG: aldo/keto reductase [Clostridiales bacterium]|nr:aldo/keto reductase [Clostridiales bacterium]